MAKFTGGCCYTCVRDAVGLHLHEKVVDRVFKGRILPGRNDGVMVHIFGIVCGPNINLSFGPRNPPFNA